MDIKFQEEKQYIIGYQYVKNHDVEKAFNLWRTKWKNDFVDENGKPLLWYDGKIIKPCNVKQRKSEQIEVCPEETDFFYETVALWERVFKDMDYRQAREVRKMICEDSVLKENVRRKAHSLGWHIQKGNPDKHPFDLSGYRIVDSTNHNICYYGKYNDLTLEDVKNLVKGQGLC